MLFVLLPFGDVVARSFRRAMGNGFVGLENYVQVLGKEGFHLAVGNTVRFTLVCIPLLMAFSLWISVLVDRTVAWNNIYKTTILLPMAIPAASVVLLWKMIFQPPGLLNQFTALFGGTARDWLGQDSAFYILVITYIWKNTGYDMVLWLAGLGGISRELYEAAEVDGAGAWQKFIYVTMPGLKRTSFLVLILSLVNSFKVFREAYLISGDYPHESIYMLQHLFNNWFLSLDLQKMCAAAVMLETVVLVPVLLWIAAARRRRQRAGEE